MKRFMKLFDPIALPTPRPLTLAPRPAGLHGLRLGLVHNTRVNAYPLLRKLAERLGHRHGMAVTETRQKRSPSHAIEADTIQALRARCDLVISGVGD